MNSCIIQNKYLLVGTKIKETKNKNKIIFQNNIEQINDSKEINNNVIIEENKNNKKAGIFIVNLDNKQTQIVYINFSHRINYIIPFKENMLLCNFESLSSNGIIYYSLTTFIYEEKNEKNILNKKRFINGNYQYINSNIIMGDFIICSSLTKNYLLKIDENGLFVTIKIFL